MKRILQLSTLAIALLLAPASAKGQAPQGATGLCRDGSYTYTLSHRGACSHHGGVSKWLSAQSAKPLPKADSTKAPAPPAPVTKPTPNAESPSSAGVKVWVNTPTMVYHCPGDRWYGKTKKGSYMTEAEAKAVGARPAYGNACH